MRTILLSRWRTSGRTNLELVREFVQEHSHATATEAWQRACLLARETPLDAQNEPRLKGLEEADDVPTADHPFFWAGYLLVDTGPRPGQLTDKPDVAIGDAPPKGDKDVVPSEKSGDDPARPEIQKPANGTQPAAEASSSGESAAGKSTPK